MQKTCSQCSAPFEVTDDELAHHDKVSPVFNGVKYNIPSPTHCPDCRMQRRLVGRNQVYLYRRSSSATGNTIFSGWPEEVPFPVYENDYWHGGSWGATSYAREIDFEKPFFEQFTELHNTVPIPAMSLVPEMVNSDYCNNATRLKNCYLSFGATEAEDCCCCEICWHAKDCLECTHTPHCELCYGCISCYSCYDCQNCLYCQDCKNSYYLMNCRSCTNCFGCVNLRHAQYCMFNQQLTKEEYEKRMSELNLTSYTQRQAIEHKCMEFFKQHPRPHAFISSTEDVDGDFITESRDVHNSYFVNDAENVKHSYYVFGKIKDCYDHSLYGNGAELTYEISVGGGNITRSAFSIQCFNNVSDLLYCWFCTNSSNCFGCISLQNKQYCIFNKQYTKEEYEELVPKLIEHMRSTGEWGEFFPMSLSPIAYNHSIAFRYYPLTKEEALGKGLKWREDDMMTEAATGVADLPDGLPESNDPITAKSDISGKPYLISSNEIERCRRFKVPLPRNTYDERMHERGEMLGKFTLYDRTCAKTGKPIKTTIPPDSPWIVWDKDAYEQEFSA